MGERPLLEGRGQVHAAVAALGQLAEPRSQVLGPGPQRLGSTAQPERLEAREVELGGKAEGEGVSKNGEADEVLAHAGGRGVAGSVAAAGEAAAAGARRLSRRIISTPNMARARLVSWLSVTSRLPRCPTTEPGS